MEHNIGSMSFLPFETITIETSVAKEDVITNLTRSIEPYSTMFGEHAKTSKPFKGRLRGNEFVIQRLPENIYLRNGFVITNGKIQAIESGTRIIVDFKLNTLVRIATFIWIGLIMIAIIGLLFQPHDKLTPLFLFGALFFGYIITMGGYWYESGNTRGELIKITQGRVTHAA